MGAVTSRPVIHTIESGLLAVARLIDALVRLIDRIFSTVVSKCLSPSLYAHFYVTPPDSAETAVHVGPNGLTRVCTDDGVCYIPATRAKQHRHWRKRNQEDRLKERMMRAEWAAAGLDVRQMQRAERERQRQKSTSNPILALKQLSRTTTMENGSTEDLAMSSKRTSIDEAASVRRTRRAIVDLAAEQVPQKSEKPPARSSPLSSNSARLINNVNRHSLRALTSVREASHDHGATIEKDCKDPSVDDAHVQGGAHVNARKHKRGMSAPVAGLVKLKAAITIDATSASRLGGASASFTEMQSCHSPVDVSSTNFQTPVVAQAPVLVQPRPRRPVRMAFDVLPNPPNFTVDLTPAGAHRSSSTPPVMPGAAAALPYRTRSSFDISPAQTPFGGRAISPGFDDDASSIRSRRSAFGAALPRSTTPSTPPPSVVQLADRACKSRWESSAKERKAWKDEVKRLALNKMHEQHAAYRASLDFKRCGTPPITSASASSTHLPT
jgi:hypothetical protein